MDCRIKSGNDGLTMRTDLFGFELPAGHIALRPASPRDGAPMIGAHRAMHNSLCVFNKWAAHFAEI